MHEFSSLDVVLLANRVHALPAGSMWREIMHYGFAGVRLGSASQGKDVVTFWRNIGYEPSASSSGFMDEGHAGAVGVL